MGRRIDRTGKQYGKWNVIELSHIKKDKVGISKAYWFCECECGTIGVVYGCNLGSGQSTSCGCSRGKHYKADSAEYRSWKAMKSRVYNPNHNSYHNYGGRGITICDRWIDSFENFFADMGQKPSLRHSLDRIDNNGNYEPSNCRWADVDTQCNNKSTNRSLSYNGITMNLSQWARKIGITEQAFSKRLRKWEYNRCFQDRTS